MLSRTASLLLTLCVVGCSVPFDTALPDAPGDSSADSADTGETGEDTATLPDTQVTGVVVGSDGLPLGGITVQSADGTAVTGADGSFTIEGRAPVAVEFSRAGLHTASRTYTHSVGDARVGLHRVRVATGVDAEVGASLAQAGATFTVPAGALGTGWAAVRFDPLDLSAGIHALPAGPIDDAGQVATVVAAAVIALEGPSGGLTASTPATVVLPITADVPGSAADVLLADGDGWSVVGAATIAASGDGYAATFTVTEGGTYAVGHLDAGGCIQGKVVDGTGADAAGATVRSYLRPVSAGRASWVDEATTAADGTFCVGGSATSAALMVEYTDPNGAVWMGTASTAAAGDPDTCTDCTDIGNVALTAAGCATGNLYAADGSVMAPSPFTWEEGAVALSAADSTLTFYARAGSAFHLSGPGGLSKSFSVSEGTTPEAATCTRLGNLQAPESCVAVDVADSAGAASGVVVTHTSGAWATTDADGDACVSSEDGTTTYVASALLGAQALTVEATLAVDAVAGSCQAGECFAGPSLLFGEAGCVSGTVYGEGGAPAAGVTFTSSSWDTATTGADGSYTLSTGGSGTGAMWGGDWGVTTFDDQPASAGCTELDLSADAGMPPALVVAMDKYVWQVTGGGSTETMLVSGAVISLTDVQVDATADLLLGLLNVYAWGGDATGAGWANFGSATSYWSALRIAPDSTVVALQGYGATNSAVWIYDLAGDTVRQLSTSAGTDVDGLAFSADSVWLASTRKDSAIEVTPVNGSRAPTTIAGSDCAHPTWWDADTVALACTGDVHLYEMDGSSHVTWLTSGEDERVWAVTSARRVFYTVGDALHVSNIDYSDDQVLHVGSAGTTYRRVRVSADGVWVAAIIDDPVEGTDVAAFPDQAPYTVTWLTDTPTESETSIDWVD